MKPDLQDIQRQHATIGWNESGLRLKTARTPALPDRRQYSENHTSTPNA